MGRERTEARMGEEERERREEGRDEGEDGKE
jgi:hypothetical protein